MTARSEFTTTTSNGDGSYTTRAYPEPVNFKDDDGRWVQIDPSLHADADGDVHPASVDGDAAVPRSLDEPLSIEHDGRTLSFRLLGADADRGTTGSTAKFDDALPHADVAYRAQATGLKETIKLDSPAARRSYRYDLTADADLMAAIDAGGNLLLRDGAGEEAFRISSPLAWDSADPQAASNALELSVVKVGDGHWTLTMKADDTWLDDPARVYPVTLDPDFYWVGAAERFHGANQDCSLQAGTQAGTSFCAANVLYAGYYNRDYKSLMRFDVQSAIPGYATATRAQLALWQFPSSQKYAVSSRLRTVTSSWDNTATWDVRSGNPTNVPWTTKGGDVSSDPNLTGPPTTINASGYWSYWDAPLAAVNGWIKGSLPNYGLQLSVDADQPKDSAYGFTSTDGDQAYWPALDVTWQPDNTAPTGVVPTPGGTVSDDQSYVGGAVSTTLNASAQDPESGVAKLELLRDGGTVVAIAIAGCGTNQANCPKSYSTNLGVNTAGWSEGRHTLYLRATNAAGLVTTTSAWNVFVDRTAPTLAEAATALKDEDTNVILSWDTQDPALSDGNAGAGVTTDSVRYLQNGVWSAWTDTADGSANLDTTATTLTLQLKSRDFAGNETTFAQSTVNVVDPDGVADDGTDPFDAGQASDDDCVGYFGSSACTPPADTAQTFAAAAASNSRPNETSTPSWGFADPNRVFNAGEVYNSFIQSDLARSIASHVRLLVPWNIYKYTNRMKALSKEIGRVDQVATETHNPDLKVMITFEAGCSQDDTRTSCAGTSLMQSDTAPTGRALTLAAKRLLQGVIDDKGKRVGQTIGYFSVWNEPNGALQPYRNGSPAKRGGLRGLEKITRYLVDPPASDPPAVCTKYPWCKIVSAEVVVPSSYAIKYASWLKRAKSSSKLKFPFYGAHDYGEVFDSAASTTPPDATNSKLAAWMKRLPDHSNVWLGEIAVTTQTSDGRNAGAEPAGRTKEADFLFNHFAKLRVPRNDSRIARADYYQFCPSSPNYLKTPGDPSSVVYVPDTSLFEPLLHGSGADCTIGATPRNEVITQLKHAVGQ